MAITTFATLKTAMRSWLTEDSTSALPDGTLDDLISFVEDDLNADRDFRLREMQSVKLTDLNPGDDDISLPTDFLEMRYVTEITDTYNGPLTYVNPATLANQRDDPGFLAYFTIVGGKMRIYPAPATSGSLQKLEMAYYAKIPALSDSNTTNWLLTKSRKTYLFGALTYAEPFLGNDPRIATWRALFQASRQQLIDANRAAVTSGGTLRVSLPEEVA